MDQQEIVAMATDRAVDLGRRLDFLLEIDKLKAIVRRNRLVDGSRYENTAEHSWHLAVAAMILAPDAGPEVDVLRAMEILLVHDIVEIDADDTYTYDTEAQRHKQALETAAAERVFGLLPEVQALRLRSLWDEYEARETPTARFAYALDRLQPLLLNAASDGASWRENGITHSQTAAVNGPIVDGSPLWWDVAQDVLGRAADNGILGDDRPEVRD